MFSPKTTARLDEQERLIHNLTTNNTYLWDAIKELKALTESLIDQSGYEKAKIPNLLKKKPGSQP